MLPGVDENLQDHLQLRMVFKVTNVVTLNQRANSLIGKMMMGLEYALFRTGLLTMAPSQLGGFTHSSREHSTPNIEYHVRPLSLDKFGDPLHRFPAFTASVCNLRPTSRGTVRIKSAYGHTRFNRLYSYAKQALARIISTRRSRRMSPYCTITVKGACRKRFLSGLKCRFTKRLQSHCAVH